MINLLHAEIYKLFKSKAFHGCFLVTTVCAVILAVLSHQVAAGNISMTADTMSGLSDIFIMSVVGSLMAGLLICADFDNKNIHDEISCGRFSIVMSKSLIFVIMISLLVLPYAIVSFVGFVSGMDFNQAFSFSTYLKLMANVKGYSINAQNIGKAVEVLVISLLLYAARLSFCIPIAFKIRKSVTVTVIGVVIGFVSDFVLSMLGKIPGVKELAKYLPFSYMMMDIGMSQKELIKILLVCIVFIGLMIWLTYALFKKSEIK